MIEFLETLQVLPPGTKHLIIDEHGQKKQWPPFDLAQGRPRRNTH